MSTMNRRSFLKQLGLTTAMGMAVPGQASGAVSEDLTEGLRTSEDFDTRLKVDDQWDQVVDVVVVGCGAAGMATAIEAHDSGLDVLIVERSPRSSHVPSTRLSAGIYQCPAINNGTENLARYIASTYIPSGLSDWDAGTMDKTLQNFAYTWAKLAPETYNWLRSLDPSFRFALFSLYTTPRFSFPGTASLNIGALISTYSRWKDFSKSSFNRPKEEKLNGEALFACLRNGVESRKIKEIYGARVTGLLKNKKGRICGVAATDEFGSPLSQKIGARCGVVLATGGFGFNKELQASLLPTPGQDFWAESGSPLNTGDGILLGIRAGAQLISSNCLFDRFAALLPQMHQGVHVGALLDCIGKAHSILVDNHGRRFVSESQLSDTKHSFGFAQELLKLDLPTLSYPRAPMWFICDEERMRSGPLATLGEGSVVNGFVTWDKDNRIPVKKGWILKASTINGLARLIADSPVNAGRMSETTLRKTVEQFNVWCETKVDRDFDRDPSTLLEIKKPPFYAMPVTLSVPFMGAGLATDERRCVIDWQNKPISGLFAAGEVAPVSRFLHDRGGHLSECLVFGRALGQYLAQEPISF